MSFSSFNEGTTAGNVGPSGESSQHRHYCYYMDPWNHARSFPNCHRHTFTSAMGFKRFWRLLPGWFLSRFAEWPNVYSDLQDFTRNFGVIGARKIALVWAKLSWSSGAKNTFDAPKLSAWVVKLFVIFARWHPWLPCTTLKSTIIAVITLS